MTELTDWLGTELQQDVWKKKYRYENETLDEFFDRVAGNNPKIKQLMIEKKFLPAGRILANRGLHKDGRKITYSNCYVITPPEDNIESIFDCAKKLARTYSYGGGCGIDISKLSPYGARINNAAKQTTGAVSFMDLYSIVTELIGQSGRRGALMISLDCDHPDLEKFIDIKNDLNKVTKANISIKITDEFMQAIKENKEWELKYTRQETKETVSKRVNARELFNKMVVNNWNMAEPGALFWSKIKDWNLLSEDTNFEYAGVNPCAEEPLPAGGSCLLSSINLSEFVLKPFTSYAEFDYGSFSETVRYAVIYLNEILDEGLLLHPLIEQRESVSDWRQIGLGIMGLADALLKLGFKYGSKESIDVSDRIASVMINTALQQSASLAKEYFPFPKYNKGSILKSPFFINNATPNTVAMVEQYGLRNSQLLTIAPTGSLSTMLGISGGIEPIYNTHFIRKTESLHGEDKYYKVYTPIVKQFMELYKINDEKDLPDYFVTAMTLNYKDRISMQSVWQKHIDASISSTVNVPELFTVEEIKDLYMLAWEQGLKGVTIYRDNCQRTGILINDKSDIETKEQDITLEWGTTLDSSDDLIGRKRKVMTGCGSLHVEAFFDPVDGKLMEIYLSKGSTGGCNSFMVALSRFISAGLRTGLDFKYAIDQLQSVPECASYAVRTATKHDTSKGKCCPNAISYALVSMQNEIFDELGIDEKVDFKVPQKQTIVQNKVFKSTCPECGEPLRFEGGCNQCSNCGYSKCS